MILAIITFFLAGIQILGIVFFRNLKAIRISSQLEMERDRQRAEREKDRERKTQQAIEEQKNLEDIQQNVPNEIRTRGRFE